MHNWDDFRYFYTLAQDGSLSKASNTLGVNHSTVSRRIHALEEKHGVKLFHRTTTGYELTEAGTSILDVASALNDGALRASRILQGKDSRLAGRINLTMPHELFESCLANPLREFISLHPDIEINLLVSKGVKNLANQEADLALRFSPSPPDYLIGKKYCHIQHGIYCHTNFQASTLSRSPIICWGDEKDIPKWAIEHLKNPFVAMRVDCLSSMFEAVSAGLGAARMPCFIADRKDVKNIKKLPASIPLSNWGLWLLHHVDLKNTARVTCLKQFLDAKLTSLVPLFLGEMSTSK